MSGSREATGLDHDGGRAPSDGAWRAQSAHNGHVGDGQLRALRTEARALVESMPGPLQRVVVRSGDHAVEVEWPRSEAPAPYPTNGHAAVPLAAEVPDADQDDTHLVLAPLVGTCYLAPEPGAAPFVAVGDLVEQGQPVAIVEAMKLMNEVAAEVAGRVVEVLAQNAAAVEFAQPLVRIAVTVDGAS
jgi:acetyl-CoA carboxylase biotin carboxyl carrier protein